MMKKLTAWILVLILVLTALPAAAEETPTELVVFAAASMTETLTEIGNAYMAEHPNVTILFNFDSSGTLRTQIKEGAAADIFISAGQKQMNEIDITASAEVNKDGSDYVPEGARFDILENKVTLCVAEGSKTGIQTFDDLAAALKGDGEILFCMGNSDVPVGGYTRKILQYYGIDEAAAAAAGKITYGSNVKEVTTQINEGTVDCGVIYCTDAFSAGLTPTDAATAEMCGQVIYPVCILKGAKDPAAAQAFLDYCIANMAVFEAVGFSSALPETPAA